MNALEVIGWAFAIAWPTIAVVAIMLTPSPGRVRGIAMHGAGK